MNHYRFAWILLLPLAAFAQPRQPNPKARPDLDRGLVQPDLKIDHAILFLKRTPAQQNDLYQFLDNLQDPASPGFHQFLTPEQFGERFGAAPEDIARVNQWLTSQGLTLEEPSRGRSTIAFSGTARTAGRAFQTEIHRYEVEGLAHFANSTTPVFPDELASLIGGVVGLDDFRPVPATMIMSPDGSHPLAPDDLATIYNFAPLLKSGIDGSGIKIGIIGQSNINRSDSDSFRILFNLPPIQLQTVLYGTDPGMRTIDLDEANLDIQWASAVARNGSIVFVYSSNSQLSLIYAIDQNIAPVLSYSFGICEPQNAYYMMEYRALAQQANAQGITIVAGSGDAGAAGCDSPFRSPSAINGVAEFDLASIPEVTAVGGTRFNESGGMFLGPVNANGAAALSYIPEVAWNDTAATSTLAATGGGPSVFFVKPPWQTGPGVPNDGARDVPDVALAASPRHLPYTWCSAGLCFTGGGTSASTPFLQG